MRRTVAIHAQVKRLSHYPSGLLVDNPVHLVVRAFDVAVCRIRAEPLAILPFRLEHGAHLLAGVLSVPLVDNIQKWRKIAILMIGAVDTVVDGDEADAGAGKEHFRVVAYLEIIASEAVHILHDY